MNRIKFQTKEKLIRKFNQLTPAHQQSSYLSENMITNISSRVLTDTEKKVLSKGLNYSTKHSKKDVLNMIASVEPAIDDLQISLEEKNSIRQRVSNSLQCIPKYNNLTSDESNAIKSLKDDVSRKDRRERRGGNQVFLI